MKSGFWGRVPEHCLEPLRSVSRTIKVESGAIVFNEKDPFRGPYVIEDGLFKIFKLNELGKEAILNFFTEGDLIAALPLLRSMPGYPASCQALRTGRISFLDYSGCQKLIQEYPELKEAFHEDFLKNAEFFQSKTSILMLSTAEERLIFFLETIGADKREVYLRIPKNQIALYLGITPEAFSRAFRHLKDTERITESEGYIRLLAPPETLA